MEKILSLLIVDQSERVRQCIKNHFLDENLKILEAENGQLAWDICRNSFPDVVITEIILPKINGFELSKAILNSSSLEVFKDVSSSPLVVAFSYLDDEFNEWWGLKQGFHKLISKYEPQGLEELREFVKAHLAKLRSQRIDYQHDTFVQKINYS